MAYKPKWIDFANETPPLGPVLPLTSGQMALPVSGVLPSGEGGGFDYSQSHSVRAEAPNKIGSGINTPYPYPNIQTSPQYAYLSGENPSGKFTNDWWEESGILKTYPPDDGFLVDPVNQSGIFHYNGSSGIFSNGESVKSKQIQDFVIFNNYIHHQRMPSNSTNGDILSIPYISTFRKSIDWNPYG